MNRSRLTLVALVVALLGGPAWAKPKPRAKAKPKTPAVLVFTDPTGDDDGAGGYDYPTDAAFPKGAFDLTQVTVEPGRKTVTFRLTFAAPLLDPWNSRSWGGPGFSVQLAQIYLATEPPPKRGTVGYTEALPGLHARFADDSRWDRVVFVSAEAPKVAARRVKDLDGFSDRAVLVPGARDVEVDGDTLVVRVPRKRFGKLAPERWGIQVVIASTDFYAPDDALLVRAVNAKAGAFRFGGGHDGLCDPNILDLLAPDRAAQRRALKWRCASEGAGLATLSLVRP